MTVDQVCEQKGNERDGDEGEGRKEEETYKEEEGRVGRGECCSS